jgi:hypothetical protein
MKTQSGIRSAVAAAFLAGGLMCGATWAGPMDTALPLELIPGIDPITGQPNKTGTVTATVTGGGATVYSFWANESDIVTFDIDGAYPSVDTSLSIHTPAPVYDDDSVSDDSTVMDSGSVADLDLGIVPDPYIQNWVAPASGLYYVAVTVSPDRVAEGGTFLNLGGTGSGAFSLIVTCAPGSTTAPACEQVATTPPDNTPPDDTGSTPPSTDVQVVRIDVRPGSKSFVRLNPKWRDSIPVAILSSRSFDARKVDVSTLTFGRTGEEQSLRKCNKGYAHLNRDRRPDLVCHFDNQSAAFELGDEVGVLRGTTVDGTPIEGRAMLKVLPEKRKHHHRHDHKKYRTHWYHR